MFLRRWHPDYEAPTFVVFRHLGTFDYIPARATVNRKHDEIQSPAGIPTVMNYKVITSETSRVTLRYTEFSG